MSQTLMIAHNRIFLVCADGCFSGKLFMTLRSSGLFGFESQSFLSQVFRDHIHVKVFSRFLNSSLGSEIWGKSHEGLENDNLLRNFGLLSCSLLQSASIDLT